jgi:DNA-directed RNA polymerase subunit L
MKAILTLLIMTCLCQALQAQIITYDYAARKYMSDQSCCLTSCCNTVSYELKNINTFAQKVKINRATISLTTDVPAEMVALFRISSASAKDLTNTNDQVNEMKKLDSAVKTVITAIVAPAASTIPLTTGNKPKTNPPTSVITKKDSVRAAALQVLKNTIDKLVNDCEDYYDKAQNIKNALALEKRLLESMKDKSLDNETKMRDALRDKKIDATTIARLKAEFDEFETAYDSVYVQYGRAVRAAQAAGETDKEARIKNAQDQITKAYEALEDEYHITLEKINDLFGKAANPASYTVWSLPLKFEGQASDADELEFLIQVDEDTFTDTFRVGGGGLKVDYSTGLVANFISDDQYFFETTPQATTATGPTLRQRQKGDGQNIITPGVAAMMHVYRRTCDNLTVGGMFGLNAGFKELTDINLSFLAGASLVLGRSQKIMLSGGLSISKVSRLKDPQYAINTAYKDVKIEDVTERVLRPSWFVALSFALTKRTVLKLTP